MENSIYIGLSRQLTLRTNMSIIANNIANMNTTGFRGQNTLFQEYVSDPKGNEDPISFVNDYGQYQVSKEGPITETGNELNVALSGPGYIGAQHPTTNEILYTRAGDFHLDAQGTLMSSANYPIMGAGGAAITVPAGSEFIKIDDRGRLSNQDGEIGAIMLTEFENEQILEAVGDNMFKSPVEGVPATETMTKQGYLEGSNVNSVIEITRMMETLRTYKSQNDIIKQEHERLRSAIQKLTKAK